MTQTPELSHHVDLRAVSARLNRTLQPQGIKAAVVYQVNRLQIALEGLDAPDRQRLPPAVLQLVRELHVPIKTIEVSGDRTGEPQAIWQQHLRVNDGQVMTNVLPMTAGRSETIAAPLPQSIAPDRGQPQSAAKIIVPPITPHSIPIACPIAIKLIAGLFLLVGALHLAIAAAMGVALYFFASAANQLPHVSIMFPDIGSTFLLAIAVAAGSGLVAIGLGQRQRWGLLLSYVLGGLMLFRGGQFLIDTWGTTTLIVPIMPVELLVMGLVVAMLVYLTRHSVTRQFR